MAKAATKQSAEDATSGVNGDLVRELAALLEETGLSEIEFGRDGWHIRVARGGVATTSIVAPTPAPGSAQTPSAPVTEDANDDAHPGVVPSPMVGVVYTAPEEGSAAFVKVGDQVSEGQTLLLIEAMKVFNPITAPRDGRIARILVSSGTPVEYGEPLLIIE